MFTLLIFCPSSVYHYQNYFDYMQVATSPLHFSDYKEQAHKIEEKAVNREKEKIITIQPPTGEKDDYDSENS